MPVKLRPRDVVGGLFALAVAAACVRLGFWQLDRLHQRRARNAEIRAARERPSLEVVGPLAADSTRNRRLHARGTYDFDHERVWRARSYEGVPGVDLLTPLRLPDGPAVLVDRGWVPSPDAHHVDQRAYRESAAADVLGLGLDAPRGRGDADPRKLADSLPYPLLPFVLQLLPPAAAYDRTRPPLRWPPPALDDGPHLSYAIQWFSFAVIIVVGSVALLRKTSTDARPTGGG